MHVQIGVGYVLVPATERSDVMLSAACWSFTVGDEYYENGLDPTRKQEYPKKMTMLRFLCQLNTKVSSLNT